MISEVRLQNYMSFGELQRCPLQPITVIVGANNSGKTNFLSVFDFVRRRGSDMPQRWHRPIASDGTLKLEWDVEFPGRDQEGAATGELAKASYAMQADWAPKPKRDKSRLTFNEQVTRVRKVFVKHGGVFGTEAPIAMNSTGLGSPKVGFAIFDLPRSHPDQPNMYDVAAAVLPMIGVRSVHLQVPVLRVDNQLAPNASISPEGSGLAALVAKWQMEEPEKFQKYNELVDKCLPEMRRVLIKCDQAGMVRLMFEQQDGERFDSNQVSDGVMIFAGLIAHAIEAPMESILLMEEPERGVHPRRLLELVDILRTLVHERRVQFIMATHSPALLNVFRDEPEAILTFRRGPTGTIVRQLSEMTDIADTLKRSDPGELLSNGVFNEAGTEQP
ncbi:MAG: AAA family ATPase [Kofleriaceae bacterium]